MQPAGTKADYWFADLTSDIALWRWEAAKGVTETELSNPRTVPALVDRLEHRVLAAHAEAGGHRDGPAGGRRGCLGRRLRGGYGSTSLRGGYGSTSATRAPRAALTVVTDAATATRAR